MFEFERSFSRWLRLGAASVATAALMVLISPIPARAAQRYMLGIYDNAEFVSPNTPQGQRQFWLDRADETGAGVIRIDLSWRGVVQDNLQRPADPANPADPNYEFAPFDAAVREAAARGMKILMTIYSAPEFAEGPDRPAECGDENDVPLTCASVGSWKPDAAEFADFGTAVATRYSGGYTPAGDPSPLPEVQFLQAWNEPNLSVFLTPQNVGGVPYSPGHYRTMLNAFYDAAHAANPDVRVLGPGTTSFGPGGDPENAYARTAPIDFLRRLACVEVVDRALTVSCASRPRFDIYAHNPIPSQTRPVTAEPYWPKADLLPANFERGTKLLSAIEDLGQAYPDVRGGRPVWATEFWIWSNPPTPEAIDLRGQADSIQQAMRMLWEKGADAFLYFKLRDQLTYDPVTNPGGCTKQCGVGLFTNTVTWPFTAGDEPPKPSLTAFRFPFTVERRSKTKASAWFRPPAKGKAVVEQKKGGRWVAIAKVKVRKGAPVQVGVAVSGRVKLRARSGSQTSLVWTLKTKSG